MDWIKKMMHSFCLIGLLVHGKCMQYFYKFNGASINYDKVKTISVADFPIKSSLRICSAGHLSSTKS